MWIDIVVAKHIPGHCWLHSPHLPCFFHGWLHCCFLIWWCRVLHWSIVNRRCRCHHHGSSSMSSYSRSNCMVDGQDASQSSFQHFRRCWSQDDGCWGQGSPWVSYACKGIFDGRALFLVNRSIGRFHLHVILGISEKGVQVGTCGSSMLHSTSIAWDCAITYQSCLPCKLWVLYWENMLEAYSCPHHHLFLWEFESPGIDDYWAAHWAQILLELDLYFCVMMRLLPCGSTIVCWQQCCCYHRAHWR